MSMGAMRGARASTWFPQPRNCSRSRGGEHGAQDEASDRHPLDVEVGLTGAILTLVRLRALGELTDVACPSLLAP